MDYFTMIIVVYITIAIVFELIQRLVGYIRIKSRINQFPYTRLGFNSILENSVNTEKITDKFLNIIVYLIVLLFVVVVAPVSFPFSVWKLLSQTIKNGFKAPKTDWEQFHESVRPEFITKDE